MNILNISGGATKISALFGALEVVLLEYNYKPDLITGISSGAVLSVIAAMFPYNPIVREKTYRKVTSFNMCDFMSVPPYNKRGKVSFKSVLRLLKGELSLGKQDNLELTLSKIITPELFEEYKSNPKYPEVVIGTVNFKDGQRQYFSIKKDDLSYSDYLKYTNASASIPIAVEPVEYKGHPLYDGGVRDHIATPYILEDSEYQGKVTSTINIFSRPENYKLGDVNWTTKKKNAVDVMLRTFDIMNIEISKNDEFMIKYLSEKQNIDSKIIYLSSYMKSLYDTDNTRLLLSYNKAIEDTRKQLNI